MSNSWSDRSVLVLSTHLLGHFFPRELCHLELTSWLLMHSHQLEWTSWTHHHRFVVLMSTKYDFWSIFSWFPSWSSMILLLLSCVSIVGLAKVVPKIIKMYRHRLDSLSWIICINLSDNYCPVFLRPSCLWSAAWCPPSWVCAGSSSIAGSVCTGS